jgi:hypothetical protein
MTPQRIVGAFLILLGIASLQADEVLQTLKGRCSIRASTNANHLELRLERGECIGNKDCHDSHTQEAQEAFTGFSLSDLSREGAHAEAILRAEAGTLTCSGSIHNSELTGDFTFEPNKAFVERMRGLGITGLDSEKLEVYTLFHIEAGWVQSLQTAGVTGIDASNLIAVKIFKVDADYVRSLNSLGYATPSAHKLIALKVQKVDPAEVRQIRAMGYQPTLDELIQMRIFKVTPEFIQQMQARGFNNLTISKLVQIRIFKLDEQ